MSKITINASPTKELFVKMITRDIAVSRAILDLVDNSIDGAHRLREDENFNGLHTKIIINKDSFTIEDNCGGISKDILEKQAFMFGKPKDYKAPYHSIGRFGIGMKRALFKMGKEFEVESICLTSKAKMNIEVKYWLDKENWDFEADIEENIFEEKDTKTKIVISDLHKGISKEFAESYFISNLKEELSFSYSFIINKGFKIILNGDTIEAKKFTIKYGENLKPEIINFTFPPKETDPNKIVKIKIIAGVTNRDINRGGWYIFCNDRLILDADKSVLTGWEYEDSNNKNNNLPKYHANYAFFRGYIFFDAENADLLPWTTIKTGLNADSEVYKATFYEMRRILKKITSFLYERAKQEAQFKKEEIDSNPLTQLIEDETIEKNLTEIKNSSNENIDLTYEVEEPKEIKNEPDEGTISYWKSKEELDILKEYFGETYNSKVGERTFDYFLEFVKGQNE